MNLTREEALARLQRNSVRIEETLDSSKKTVIARTIKLTRPIGLKIWSAVDCLCHYHGFRVA